MGLKVLAALIVLVIQLFILSRVALQAEGSNESGTQVLFWLLLLLFGLIDAAAALWFLILIWR